ncbi:hypothetical protein pb186bvf_010597 [Paramecium bursaria]
MDQIIKDVFEDKELNYKFLNLVQEQDYEEQQIILISFVTSTKQYDNKEIHGFLIKEYGKLYNQYNISVSGLLDWEYDEEEEEEEWEEDDEEEQEEIQLKNKEEENEEDDEEEINEIENEVQDEDQWEYYDYQPDNEQKIIEDNSKQDQSFQQTKQPQSQSQQGMRAKTPKDTILPKIKPQTNRPNSQKPTMKTQQQKPSTTSLGAKQTSIRFPSGMARKK